MIKECIEAAQPGDVIDIPAGVYDVDVIRTEHGGTPDQPITVRGQGDVIWRGGNASGYLWHIGDVSCWNVENITFENIVEVGSWDGKLAQHIAFKGCTWRNSNAGGLAIPYAQHVTVEGCRFVGLRSGIVGRDLNAIGIPGPYWTDDITITGCTFEDIGSDCVHIGARAANIGAVTIARCRFTITGTRGPVGEDGIDIKPAEGPITVRGNHFSGFVLGGPDSSSGVYPMTAISLNPQNGGGAARNVLVEGNEFEGNNTHVKVYEADDNIVIRSNVFGRTVDIEPSADYERGQEGSAIWAWRNCYPQIVDNTFENCRHFVSSWPETNAGGVLKGNRFVGEGDFPGIEWDLWDVGENEYVEGNVDVIDHLTAAEKLLRDAGLDAEADQIAVLVVSLRARDDELDAQARVIDDD